MAWILNALHSVQDAFNSSTPAPTAAPELVLPHLKWILNAFHSVQDAFNFSTPAPTATPELVLPDLNKLNDSVYELCKPSVSGSPSVELVFFHGLQFDGSEMTHLTTWLSKDGQGSWLPWIFEYFPGARILLISYDGCVKKINKERGPDMYITSENLWQDLIDAPVGQDGCPVVLVGHSLGGLVMKEVLLKANAVLSLNPDKKVKEKLGFLLQNVKHLFYYSCPHSGTKLADIERKFLKGQLFKHLTTLNEQAARCNEEFRKLRLTSKWKAFSVVEALPTDLGQLGSQIVVEEASARYDTDGYYTAQHSDHVNICRPESRTDASFSKLKNVINQALAGDVKGDKLRVSRDEVVGLDKQVKMVQDKLEESRQVGLFGPGGIGKTTLAKLVYNDMSDNFEYTSFVSEVKGSVRKSASMEALQAEILKNLHCKGRQVKSEWSTLEGKRVLIGLDDVEDDSQILRLTDSGFSADSCILLTSRGRRILTLNDFRVHDVEFLDYVASRRLFCNHAFKNATAPEAYKERVERFTKKCGGWPLILQVTGKYLFKQKQGVWDDAFDRLCQAKPLEGNIDADKFWPIFKVIYRSLDIPEQQMFLDIAVFFHDEELEPVKRAWKVYRELSDGAWQNLVEMGLVTAIREYRKTKKIQMHEVLRDLGRSIACPDPRNIQGHSHVCLDIDSSRWPFEQGNSKVEILKIVSRRERDDGRIPRGTMIDTGELRGLENLKALWLDSVGLRGAWNLLPAKLEFLKMEHHSRRWYDDGDGYSGTLFSSSREEKDCPQPHAKLRHVEIGSDSVWFPEHIVLGPPMDTLDQLQALEYLYFSKGRSRDLPHRFNQHGALKYLRFGNYMDEALPDSLADLQALEHLEIGSSWLKSLPDTLGQLGALKSLTIIRYPGETIPDSLGQLSALESLTLTWCTNLSALPSTLGELSSLKSLTLSNCVGLRMLPSSLGQLKALGRLKIDACMGLVAIPKTLGQLDGLRMLSIAKCFSLRRLPQSLGKLQALSHLVIRDCYLDALPNVFGKLQALSHLVIRGCHRLPSLPPTLKELPGLRHLEELPGLRHLELDRGTLETLENILGKLRPLQHCTLFSDLDPRAIQETLGQLDAVKHLKVWIGKHSHHRVEIIREDFWREGYFEILPSVTRH